MVSTDPATATGFSGFWWIFLGVLTLNQKMWYHVRWWVLVDFENLIEYLSLEIWFADHHEPITSHVVRFAPQTSSDWSRNSVQNRSNLNKSKNDIVQYCSMWSTMVHQQTWKIGFWEIGTGHPHIEWSEYIKIMGFRLRKCSLQPWSVVTNPCYPLVI